ncbi:MAG: GTPase (G3E family) [Eggerthellaceae bacterium]|nr:GTPase (G3E family) [Eggerthellaceae bacterium]
MGNELPKYLVVSGFLGAGKTTSMIAMARVINKKYGQAAIIANDLGAKNLVDADYTRTTDVAISEITGDCICYVTEDLVHRIDGLVADGANIVMSDIPGCGLGALDHVYIKLKNNYPDRYDLLPFLVIVDPERLRMILPERANINLTEEMRFLLDAQLAEADLIVLNKTDLISGEERDADLAFIQEAYPEIPVMSMSAKTGEGVEDVVDYLVTHRANAEHRELGDDAEEFDAAEKQMCWYNRRFFASVRDESNIDFNQVVDDFIEAIRDGLIEAKRNVPHLKLFAAGEGEDFVKASLLGVDYDIQYDHRLERNYTAMAIVVNARALCESETLGEVIEDAMDFIKAEHNLKCNVLFTECFGLFDEGRSNGGRASRY